MMGFHQFILEKQNMTGYNILLISLISKINRISNRIEQETDPSKQNRLIAQQIKVISYLNGLSVGITLKNKKLIRKFSRVR